MLGKNNIFMAAQRNLHISPNFICEEEKPFSFPLLLSERASFLEFPSQRNKGGKGGEGILFRLPSKTATTTARKEGRKEEEVDKHASED